MASFLPVAFADYPEEGNMIGRLVVGYGELETLLAFCVGATLGNDDQALRLIFRVHGEEQRIEIADAIARPYLEAKGLADFWNDSLGAIRHCKAIRNQFAHSQWVTDDKGLMFGDWGKGSQKRKGEVTAQFKPIHTDVLLQQLTWFSHTGLLLQHVQKLYEWAGESASQKPKGPKRVPRPPLSNWTGSNSNPTTDSEHREIPEECLPE